MNKSDLVAYAAALPKAELLLHIEGSLEPEMVLSLARRNKTDIPFATVDDIRTAYRFSNPNQYSDIYRQSQQVLRTEEDFFDLTMAYLNRARAHNVRHAEITFSPHRHISRGVSLNTVIGGIMTALSLAKMQFGMTASLIMNFSSNLSKDTTLEIMRLAEPWLEQLNGICVGIEDSDHAPSKFKDLITAAHERKLKCVVQFGHNSSVLQSREALGQLNIDRIGYSGNISIDDTIFELLAKGEITITACPLSEMFLSAVEPTAPYPLKNFLDRDIGVTINSNAPAFLGGYIMDNFKASIEKSELSFGDIKRLAKNSFDGSFLPEGQKRAQIAAVDLV